MGAIQREMRWIIKEFLIYKASMYRYEKFQLQGIEEIKGKKFIYAKGFLSSRVLSYLVK